MQEAIRGETTDLERVIHEQKASKFVPPAFSEKLKNLKSFMKELIALEDDIKKRNDKSTHPLLDTIELQKKALSKQIERMVGAETEED